MQNTCYNIVKLYNKVKLNDQLLAPNHLPTMHACTFLLKK
jgi:hypothetical protein